MADGAFKAAVGAGECRDWLGGKPADTGARKEQDYRHFE